MCIHPYIALIRAAYKRLVLELHPDKSSKLEMEEEEQALQQSGEQAQQQKGEPAPALHTSSVAQFIAVQEAWEILGECL